MDSNDARRRLDTITTVNGGIKPSQAVARSDALLGYESGNSRPPEDLAVEFVDFPFSKSGDPAERWENHMAAVERETPRYAVAPDVDDAADLDDAIDKADELAEHADVVIMVPKGVHPTDIPARFRVGLPLANWDVRTEEIDVDEFADVGTPAMWQWTDYVDVGDVHLLGGSPTVQRQVAKYGVDVRSVDGSSAFMAAQKGSVWGPQFSRNWHPSHNDEMDMYDRLRASLDNIHAAWNSADPEYTIPTDPDEYAEALATAAPQVENERDRLRAERGEDVDAMDDLEREYRRHRGQPIIPEDTADLWGEYGEAPGEHFDESARLEDATRDALEALDDGMEQAGLAEYQTTKSAATDGGIPSMSSDNSDPYDPTEEWNSGGQADLTGEQRGQQEFDAPAPQKDESKIESVDEVNDGGLMADTRDLDDDDEGEQGTLQGIGAGARREADQGGLDDVVDDEDDDSDLVETAKEMKRERERPLPADEEGAQYDGIDRREIPDSGLSLSDITDWPSHGKETSSPTDDEVEHFNEMMSGVYDPTDDVDGARGIEETPHGTAMIQQAAMGDDSDDVDDEKTGADEWADAVEYVREHYGDDYQDRIELGSDLSTFAHDNGHPTPPELGAEGVLQPLIRFQDIPAHDVYQQIDNSTGGKADTIQEIVMAFAEEGAARDAVDDDADASIDAPAPWTVVDDSEHAEREPSILAEHPDGYTAEVWQRSEDVSQGAGQWDVEYTDPAGTRRDGSGTFHDSAQAAFDELAPHIKEVRAERRERAAQAEEMERTEWPEQMSRYTLKPGHSPKAATYETRYLQGHTILGAQHRTNELEIRRYEDTNDWHVGSKQFGRKASAIEAAREILENRTEEYDQREREAYEENKDKLPAHHVPERVADDVDAVDEDRTHWFVENDDVDERNGPFYNAPLARKKSNELGEGWAMERYGPEPTHPGQGSQQGASDDDAGADDQSPTESEESDSDDSAAPDKVGNFRKETEQGDMVIWSHTDQSITLTVNPQGGDDYKVLLSRMGVEGTLTQGVTWEQAVDEAVEWMETQSSAPESSKKENHPEPPERKTGDLYQRLRDEGVPGNGAKALSRRFDDWGDVAGSRVGEIYEISGVGNVAMSNLVPESTDYRTMKLTVEEARNRDDDDGEKYEPTADYHEGQVVEHNDGREGVVDGTTSTSVYVEWDGSDDRQAVSPNALTIVADDVDDLEDDEDDDSQDAKPWSYVNFPDRHETGAGTFELVRSSPTRMKYEREMSENAVEVTVAEKRGTGENAGKWTVTGYTNSEENGMANHRQVGVADNAEQLKEMLLDDLGPSVDDEDDEDDVAERAGEKIRFGTLDQANEWRDDHADALHPNDKRSTKTITLHPDVDDDVANDAGEAAAISTSDESKSYGQETLSEDERTTLKRNYDTWDWNKYGFGAMRAKAALHAEGATDWLNYYEPGEGADGALKNLEAGKEAEADGRGQAAIKGHRIDSDPDPGEIGQALDEAKGMAEGHARGACESGDPLACDELLREFGWTEEEVEQLKETAADMGEDPERIFDPADPVDDDPGIAFAEWAKQNEPDAVEPPDSELVDLAPTPTPDELSGPALRTLKKAWSGYKLARQEHREAKGRADQYARVINGVRAVNGQEPLEFEQLDEWSGGEKMPDDPEATFPAPEGGQETLQEAQEHGHAAGAVQSTIKKFSALAGDTYDPTEEF